MTENKTIFTLTAVLDNTGRLKVKTDGICTNDIVGKVIEEIRCQYVGTIINIDKTLILDVEDGEFYEEVEDGEVADADDYGADGADDIGSSDPEADDQVADSAE